MKKWIEFNIKHPLVVLFILLIITIFSIIGVSKVHFDSRTDVLMPRKNIAYRNLIRTREVFGDAKTFFLTAVEPTKGEKLLSFKVFNSFRSLVGELREFKKFSPQIENRRLKLIMSSGGVRIYPPKKKIVAKSSGNSSDLKGEINSELDDESSRKVVVVPKKAKDDSFDDINNELSDKKNIQQKDDTTDIWSRKFRVNSSPFVKAIRKRNIFDYSKYKAVSLNEIKLKLDPAAKLQLASILRVYKIDVNPEQKLSLENYKKILEAWETLLLYKSMEIVSTIFDPIFGGDISGSKKGISFRSFINQKDGAPIIPQTKTEFKVFENRLRQNPLYKSFLYAENKKGELRAISLIMTLAQIKDYKEIFNYLYGVIEKYNKAPLKLTTLGSFVLQKYLKAYMINDLAKLTPIVVFVVILTFFFNFRSKRGVILPTLSVMLSSLWTFGLIGFLGVPITIVVNLLPPLLIAIGSSYSIHILNQYFIDQELLNSNGVKKGLKISMKHIGLTVMLAALTTMLGFLTLALSQVSTLRDFGIFATVGTFFSMGIAISLIPSVLVLLKPLSLSGKKGEKQKSKFVDKLLSLFDMLSQKYAKKVVLITTTVVIIFGFGLTQLQVDTSVSKMLKKDSFLYKADKRISDLFNGFIMSNLIIDSGEKGGALKSAFLKKVAALRKWIVIEKNRKAFCYLHTMAIGDIISRANMAMHNDDKVHFRIPDKDSTIKDYFELLSGKDRNSDGRVDSIEQFIGPNYRFVNILIRKGSHKGEVVSSIKSVAGQKSIGEYIRKHFSKKVKYRITGEPSVYIALNDLVVKGQVQSLFLTLIFVSIVIYLLFLNWKAGLLALIPIGSSVIFVYGMMGFLGIPLDITKAILAAIAIGIGVDDTIHILKSIKYYRQKGKTMQESVKFAQMKAGLAIVYTTIALVLGFSVLLVSEFKPVFFLGFLVALTLFITNLAALVLLPAVIIYFDISFDKVSQGWIGKKLNIGRFFEADEE